MPSAMGPVPEPSPAQRAPPWAQILAALLAGRNRPASPPPCRPLPAPVGADTSEVHVMHSFHMDSAAGRGDRQLMCCSGLRNRHQRIALACTEPLAERMRASIQMLHKAALRQQLNEGLRQSRRTSSCSLMPQSSSYLQATVQ